MPTITPQVRAQINPDPENFQQPRKTVTQSTGMNIQKVASANQQPLAEAKIGQAVIDEAQTAPAVTLSPKMAALAREQRKLQQEIQAQREKEATWEKEKAAYIPRDSFKAKLQQNAAEALNDLGVGYEELTNLLIAQQNGADPVQELRTEINQLKKNQEDSVNKQYDATIKQYKAEATALVAKDAKKYHLITKEGAQDAVVQHIVDTWEENPDQVLTVEEAANDIEEFLREEAKKYKAYLDELDGPKPPAQAQNPKTLPPPKTQAPRTLTQSVESAPQRTFNQFQHLSMKERIAAAVARASK